MMQPHLAHLKSECYLAQLAGMKILCSISYFFSCLASEILTWLIRIDMPKSYSRDTGK